jgi:vacuolar-type H+-ATPase catalytic subunit A/Vma1
MRIADAIEQEIDRIRLNIYEETKGLTPEQRAERTNKIAEAASRKYGFKILRNAKER